MSMWTDWFIADEQDASAIATIITTEDHGYDDWPHIELPSIGPSELMALWAVLRGTPGNWISTNGELLYQEGDLGEEGAIYVSRVLPEFVHALAMVRANRLSEVAAGWIADECMADWDEVDARRVLKEAVEFAKKAESANKPVLQMDVI